MAKKPDPDSSDRAAELHQEIEQLKRGDKAKPSRTDASPAAKRPMSPREFIQRRMAELDKKNK